MYSPDTANLTGILGATGQSDKKADVAEHLRGIRPRRLTRQRAFRHTPGCPSSSLPTGARTFSGAEGHCNGASAITLYGQAPAKQGNADLVRVSALAGRTRAAKLPPSNAVSSPR